LTFCQQNNQQLKLKAQLAKKQNTNRKFLRVGLDFRIVEFVFLQIFDIDHNNLQLDLTIKVVFLILNNKNYFEPKSNQH